MTESLLTDAALAMVGSEWPTRRETIETGAVRRWCRAVFIPDEVWDPTKAVPTTFCISVAKTPMNRAAATSSFDADEEPSYWLPPLRSSRSFNGGDQFVIHHQLRVGDIVERTSRLESLTDRHTSDGRLRAFAVSATRYFVEGELCVTHENTTITVPETEMTRRSPQRVGADPGDTPVGAGASSPATTVVGAAVGRPMEATVGTLEIARFAGVNEEFSYQHMDKDFARGKMGLPTTTIMGWLKAGMAATMIDLWAGFGNVTRMRTRYRGIDFCDDTLRVTGTVASVSADEVDLEARVTNHRREVNTLVWATVRR